MYEIFQQNLVLFPVPDPKVPSLHDGGKGQGPDGLSPEYWSAGY